VVWTSDDLGGSIDRLLEQLAGARSTNIDVRSVRRRARRVRRTRLVRHLGAVAVAVAAAVALSQSMIGGTAQQGDLSANDAARTADVEPDAEATATTVARASPGPATPAPRRDLTGGSSGVTGPVPLVPSATTGTTWARDQAYDLVVSPDDVTFGGDGTDAPTRTVRRVSSW
jgi:hypothetical protein